MAKILIVDDERTSRLRVSQVAQSLGLATIGASDGIRALSILEDNSDILCIVTDWQMPNLDGPGLIARIRKAGGEQPILVYSAFRSVKDVAGLLELGATGFLNYPVTRENLSEYLNRHLFPA